MLLKIRLSGCGDQPGRHPQRPVPETPVQVLLDNVFHAQLAQALGVGLSPHQVGD